MIPKVGSDLARLICEFTFPTNGWDEVSSTVEQLDEWRIQASRMPANGVLEPIGVGESVTFKLERAGSFNWVIGAKTTGGPNCEWTAEDYLIKAKSHVFLTRSKFSLNGNFRIEKYPVRDLDNDDTVSLTRKSGKLIWSVANMKETFGEVNVSDDQTITPVIGLSTGGVCEIVGFQDIRGTAC